MAQKRTPAELIARRKYRGRMVLLFTALALLVSAVFIRLLYLQTIESDDLRRKAQRMRNHSVSLHKRGRILDRNGLILAQDTYLYDIYAHPKYYWGVSPQLIAKGLAPALHRPERELAQILSAPEFTIRVAKNLRRQVIDRIRNQRILVPVTAEKPRQGSLGNLLSFATGADKQAVDYPAPDAPEAPDAAYKPMKLPGLDFVRKTVRNYPQGSLGAHILGYVNDEADIGSGVEHSARDRLRQMPAGIHPPQLDGRGGLINVSEMSPREIVTEIKAEDTRLTLDARIQHVAERELAAGMARSKAKRGAAIVMDPKTGEILAFAVMPTYEPDRYFRAEPAVLKNWAITDVYPPGSTFKILTVTSGLELGVIQPDSRILDTGKMTIGSWTIHNYDYAKHPNPGNIDLVYLFQHSSNVASATIASKLPAQGHHAILDKLSIGRRTGIDIPGEAGGILQDWKRWDTATHASVGYGYGIAITPLQLAAAVSAIANNGVWITPHVLQDQPAVVKRRVFSAKTTADVSRLLTQSIENVHQSPVKLPGFEVAGKTGTSRKPNENGRGYTNELFTSFVGFFPAQAPRVLITVVVDSPSAGNAWGSTVAAPIFREIAQETIRIMGLKPAKIGVKSS